MLRIGLLVLLVLFSNARISEHSGEIYILFSNVILSETIDADIYAIFSTVTINNADIEGEVLTLSSKIYSNNESKPTIRQIIPVFSLFLRNEQTHTPYLIHDDSIPIIVFQLIFVFIQLSLFYIFLAIKKSFIEQASLALQYEPKYVLTVGIMAYFILICITLAFFTSIIAIPIALLVILLCIALVLIGQASFSIAVGHFVSKKISLNFEIHTIYTDLLIGMFVIFIFQIIPFVNVLIYLILLPVCCLGLLSIAFANAIIRKVFYVSNYGLPQDEKVFHKSKIRDIIVARK